MIRRPPRSTRTDTLFPYPTLFRSVAQSRVDVEQARGRGAEPVMLAAGIEFRKLLADERFEDAETGARAEIGGARNRVDALAFVTGKISQDRDRVDDGSYGRSEERRVGTECGRTCRFVWLPNY